MQYMYDDITSADHSGTKMGSNDHLFPNDITVCISDFHRLVAMPVPEGVFRNLRDY